MGSDLLCDFGTGETWTFLHSSEISSLSEMKIVKLRDNRSNAQGSLFEHMCRDVIITLAFGGIKSPQ